MSARDLVRLRPHRSSDFISYGRTSLATALDGSMGEEPIHGLWFYETRVLSRYTWRIDGSRPEVAGASPLTQNSWLGYFIRRSRRWREAGEDENPAQQPIELRLARRVDAGMREDVELTNHTQITTMVRLELEVDADFADAAEASGERQQHGSRTRAFRALAGDERELRFEYRAEHAYDHQGDAGTASICRSVVLEVDGSPRDEGDRLVFDVELAPHATWRASLRWTPSLHEETPAGAHPAIAAETRGSAEELVDAFVARSTKLDVSGPGALAGVVERAFARARTDLASLRLDDLDVSDAAWVLAGGVPIYLTLFGRDSLIASWQAGLLSAEMMHGALVQLARTQGSRDDPWRDEQPGRIVHETHTGPLAALKFGPHGRYYGDITSSLFYPFVVSMFWHWVGDGELVRPLVEPALRALEWADRNGDLDGDGFYEYRTRSEQGEKNQGWKDSGDAIVYPDGTQVPDPLGTCEMQGFAYASKMLFAELLVWLGELEEARRLFEGARRLKRRFNEAFWMPDERFLALGLDADKRQIRSIACDPGFCLSSGIVDEAFVPHIAARLMAPELFSGWGIRTLSTRHPAYNPFAYHRGTVWPVANAVIALGLGRYGCIPELHALSKAHLEAASLFEHARLPECFAGHARDDAHPFPGLYPRANWPQAWSSSSIFAVLEAMLGVYPYAAMRVLFVDPWLPEWLPEITLRDVRVGDATATIRFRRRGRGPKARTDFEVLSREGRLFVVRQPSPLSLFATAGERIRDVVESVLEHRSAG